MRLRPKALTLTRASAALGWGLGTVARKRDDAGPLPFLMSCFFIHVKNRGSEGDGQERLERKTQKNFCLRKGD